jgi:thioredoxin-related protein
MKQLILCLVIVISTLATFAQDVEKSKIYNPLANAEQQISDAVAIAKKENKHVLLQIGGNWCIWCIRFHNFVTNDSMLKSTLDKNYVIVHINYSDENKNEKLMQKLEYPARFGFPVFVILDANGKRIHTENSAYLEEDKGYSKKKVAEFFKHWSPMAVNPANYKK